MHLFRKKNVKEIILNSNTGNGVSLQRERERESGLCPTPKLRVVSAQLGRIEGRPLGRGPGEGLKEDFVYLFAFCNVSNAGTLITLFYLAVFKAIFASV